MYPAQAELAANVENIGRDMTFQSNGSGRWSTGWRRPVGLRKSRLTRSLPAGLSIVGLIWGLVYRPGRRRGGMARSP